MDVGEDKIISQCPLDVDLMESLFETQIRPPKLYIDGMQGAAYRFEKNWCGDPHTTAAPPVADFMVFGGRDTFHVSSFEGESRRQKKADDAVCLSSVLCGYVPVQNGVSLKGGLGLREC